MKKAYALLFFLSVHFLLCTNLQAQSDHSVARDWMEELLTSIRNDLARPTVHARNLFHMSAAMYDAWAFFDDQAETYMLGKTVNGFSCDSPFLNSINKADLDQEEVISFAAFTLLNHRFRNAERYPTLSLRYSRLLEQLGYEFSYQTNISDGTSAALGQFIGQCYIEYGWTDGSNEKERYANQFYEPVNPPIAPLFSGNPDLKDLNRWQQVQLEVFIGQSGFVSGDLQPFLSPEWGNVYPFAMNEQDRVKKRRDGHDYWIYHDPGAPPRFDDFQNGGHEFYKWNFSTVAVWSGHLSPWDNVMWDISPATIGNNPELPEDWSEYADFYNRRDGGDASRGHAINPVTGEPYEPNIVPRGDFTRVLAEFWADGPDSETPPGHWFTILNYVSDHPMVVKKFKGEGPVLSDLEWDIKSYFVLGGAMHDAAVSAWSVKGYYDYIRPVSAIRGLSDLGQAVSSALPTYDPNSFGQEMDYIDVVRFGDPLTQFNNEAIDKLKIKAWRGPAYIFNPAVEQAGVDWILAENWWPYQRPTFVTPPFAGYVSGHSTFSRAAAEVLTLFTGDEFFPGGMGEFIARKNQFLVFEEGPSVDVTLQWATYRDASDQTSLSRIWGGIHPPVDDIPGRKMGIEVGVDAFAFAEQFFTGKVPDEFGLNQLNIEVAPNPVLSGDMLNVSVFRDIDQMQFQLVDMNGGIVEDVNISYSEKTVQLDTQNLAPGLYVLRMSNGYVGESIRFVVR
ncbi:T9SS type A sorting domain-containing protein [Roseivirga sp.]|uniref:T9SS type A sorting domain-containing protein n=1 Tax=Roseivirga sp. TaxID=1964215 RepID=UPI003B521246